MSVHVSPIAKHQVSAILKADPSDRELLRSIDSLTRRFEPRIRRAFLEAIADIKSRVDLKALEAALRAGDNAEALAIVDRALGNAAFRQLAEQVRASFTAGGALGAQTMRQFAPTVLDVHFDALNPDTADVVRTYEFNLIRELSDSTRQTVANVLRRTVVEGINPLDAARDIRQSIGLTSRQEQAVNNYRRALEDKDYTAARSRELSDGRSDAKLRRMAKPRIQDREELSPKQIDRMVTRYRERYLKHRSENIARTESIRAVQAGNYYAWKRMADEGVIDATKVRRKWIYTADSRVRHAHMTIPSLNPDGVKLDEPFMSTLGPILYPGDPSADPANTINCRCSSVIRLLP